MDAAVPPSDLSRVPATFIAMMFQSMSLSDRFTCALVCKAWAQEATAATRSIILRHRIQDLTCLQRWMEKHGGQVEVLQLHKCLDSAVLTALPCPQLQDLLLINMRGNISLHGRVWSDITAANKLTSVALERVQTASQQADVLSALTALPDLEQLTWSRVRCGRELGLTDSMLLQKLTKLTALKLEFAGAAAAALEHLGLLTRLQDLSLSVAADWAAAGCPGLQELKALTSLKLLDGFKDIPPSVTQLTALHQLNVPSATPTALNKLSVLTGLTCVCVEYLDELKGLPPGSPPLQLPGLQSLQVHTGCGTMPMSFLANCTQLRVLSLHDAVLNGPGSLVASSMLQHLELGDCRLRVAADGAAGPVSWQQVFSGLGRLPHLTSLKLIRPDPALQHADMECVVSSCSSLQALHLHTLQDSFASTLTHLSGLTSFILGSGSDQDCSSLAQLTGLRELRVMKAGQVSAAGLRQLAALEQLTSLGLGLCNVGRRSRVLREHMSDKLPGPPNEFMYAIVNKVCACVWGGIHPQSLESSCCES